MTAGLLALLAMVVLVSPTGTHAADARSGLSEAEAQVAAAEADLATAGDQLDAARARYRAASRRAAPAVENARTARAGARTLEAKLTAQQRGATAEIAERESTHRQEVEEHDEDVAFGIGIGLAALVAGGIALLWSGFRTSPVVIGLADLDLIRALALCLGGGFLVLVVGAALSGAGGFSGALGAFLFGLSIVLATVLLLARHSIEVERSKAKPAFGRERLPHWVARGIAVLLLIIGLTGLGSSVLSDKPTRERPPAELREVARPPKEGPGASELATAESKAQAATETAALPLARQQAARRALRLASRAALGARNSLGKAESKQRRLARQVVALEEREEREAVRAAEREEQQLAEEEESEAPSGCDPNYTGCVPPYPPDADCDEVGETVTVTGSDPHGLDADGDLVACE